MGNSNIFTSTRLPISSTIDVLSSIKWTKILFDGQSSDIQYGDIEIDRAGDVWVSGQIITFTDDYRYPILGEGAVERISPSGTDSIDYNLGRNGISRYIIDLVDSLMACLLLEATLLHILAIAVTPMYGNLTIGGLVNILK